jgi:hypothetical protein
MGGVESNCFDQSVFEKVFLGHPESNSPSDQIQNFEMSEPMNFEQERPRENLIIEGIFPLRNRSNETESSNMPIENQFNCTPEVFTTSDSRVSPDLSRHEPSSFKVSSSEFGTFSDMLTVDTRLDFFSYLK